MILVEKVPSEAMVSLLVAFCFVWIFPVIVSHKSLFITFVDLKYSSFYRKGETITLSLKVIWGQLKIFYIQSSLLLQHDNDGCLVT